MFLRFPGHCFTLTLLLLAGCQGYDIKLNDRVVYTPKPLLEDIEVTDSALHTCILETVNSELITAAAKLNSLNCAHAGIESIEGLAAFSGLQILRLSVNRIRNLVELGNLTDLRELYLDGNAIVDPVPLYELSHLSYLDLSKNPNLQCPDVANFAPTTTVILPLHCQTR